MNNRSVAQLTIGVELREAIKVNQAIQQLEDAARNPLIPDGPHSNAMFYIQLTLSHLNSSVDHSIVVLDRKNDGIQQLILENNLDAKNKEFAQYFFRLYFSLKKLRLQLNEFAPVFNDEMVTPETLRYRINEVIASRVGKSRVDRIKQSIADNRSIHKKDIQWLSDLFSLDENLTQAIRRISEFNVKLYAHKNADLRQLTDTAAIIQQSTTYFVEHGNGCFNSVALQQSASKISEIAGRETSFHTTFNSTERKVIKGEQDIVRDYVDNLLQLGRSYRENLGLDGKFKADFETYKARLQQPAQRQQDPAVALLNRRSNKSGFLRRHWLTLAAATTIGGLAGAGVGFTLGWFFVPVTFGLSVPVLSGICAAAGAVVGAAAGLVTSLVACKVSDSCTRHKKSADEDRAPLMSEQVNDLHANVSGRRSLLLSSSSSDDLRSVASSVEDLSLSTAAKAKSKLSSSAAAPVACDLDEDTTNELLRACAALEVAAGVSSNQSALFSSSLRSAACSTDLSHAPARPDDCNRAESPRPL